MKRPAISLPEIARCYYLRLRGRIRCQLCERSLTRPVEGLPPTTMGFPLTLPVIAGLAVAVDDAAYVLPPGLHPLLRLRFRIYALPLMRRPSL